MMLHDWDYTVLGELYCCKRCGAVAEQNDGYDGYIYTRAECTDAPNVIPMTLRRVAQIRETKPRVVVEKIDGSRVYVYTHDDNDGAT